MPGRNNHLRSIRWHEDQVQRWNASATSADVLSATTTIAIIAGGRPAAADTTTTVAILWRLGTRKAGLPVRARDTTMTTTDALHVRAMTTKMMTGAAVDTAVGSAIPRVTLRPHDTAGRSAAGLAATIATTTAVVPCLHVTTKAGSPAHGRDTMMTTDALHVRAIAKRMMTGAVVAGMAVGSAIQRATPRRHGAAGMSVSVRVAAIATMMMIAAVICLRGT